MLTGVLGVIAGAVMGLKLRAKNPTVDAVICGFGALIGLPIVFAMLLLAAGPVVFTVIAAFFGIFFINLYWALANDMLMVISDINIYLLFKTN